MAQILDNILYLGLIDDTVCLTKSSKSLSFNVSSTGNISLKIDNANLFNLSNTKLTLTSVSLNIAYNSTYYTKFIQSATGLTLTPAVNSTTAFKFNKADGTTNVVTIDTTNGRLGVGTTSPSAKLDVSGSFYTAYNTGNQAFFGTTTANSTYKFQFYGDVSDFPRLALVNYQTSALAAIASPMTFKLTSTGDMTNGFGPGFLYAIQDDAGVENFIARTAAVRYGADNRGLFQIELFNYGAIVTVATFLPDGNVGIGCVPSARLHVLSTTEQLRLAYDTTYYTKHIQSATGLTYTPSVNSTTAFNFTNVAGDFTLTVDTITRKAVAYAMTIGSIGQATITSAGYFRTGLGAVETPAYSFSAATNYGFYYASSSVRVSAGGADVATFKSNGTVGIGTLSPTSILHVSGSFARLNTSVTIDTTLDATHYRVLCSNTITITLPTAINIKDREYNIINVGTGTVTIATTSSQTISGESSLTLNQWDSVVVTSDNSNWIRCS